MNSAAASYVTDLYFYATITRHSAAYRAPTTRLSFKKPTAGRGECGGVLLLLCSHLPSTQQLQKTNSGTNQSEILPDG